MTPLFKHVIATTAVLAIAVVAAFALFIQFGIYNFAADAPHTPLVFSLLDRMRDRSVATHADNIPVPDLTDQRRIVQGSGNYAAMCVQCHRAPGMGETELSLGLYPTPPNLAKESVEAAHAFWVIKHGIKASGMPAWGKSMNDDYIWNMTAFLQVLPKLDEADYQKMVAQSGGHSHGGGETHGAAESEGHDHGEGDHHHSHANDPTDHAHSDTGAHEKAAAGPTATIHTHADGSQHRHVSHGGTK